MQQGKYRKVSIAEDLVERIENLVSEGGLGYRSVSDFVHEAVRLRLQQLQRKGP